MRTTTLRLCSHAIVIGGLLGSVVAVRPTMALRSGPVTGESIALGGAWLVIAGCVGWLSIVSLLYVATVRTRHEFVARRCVRLMPRFVRHLLEVALVTTAVTAPTLPASAAPKLPTPAVVHDEPIVRTMPATTRRAPQRAPEHVAAAPTATISSSAPMPRERERVHVVQPGDNLWRIAREELAAGRDGEPPDELSIARYWHQVVAANSGTLRSGNPSLIYAGELVALPPAD